MGRVGSASIILIFSVLCLAIFTAISFVTALTEQNLIEAEVRTVKAYYAADTLAEQILAELLSLGWYDERPEEIMGVEIMVDFDDTIWWEERISFVSNISETKELYVQVLLSEDGSYEILTWRVYGIGEWEADERLNVWQGVFDEDFFEAVISW